MKKTHTKLIENAVGLKRRPTFEELITKVTEGGQEKIKYPDRKASQMRGSFLLSSPDGTGTAKMDLMDKFLDDQAIGHMLLRQLARTMNVSFAELRHLTQATGYVPRRLGDLDEASRQHAVTPDQFSQRFITPAASPAYSANLPVVSSSSAAASVTVGGGGDAMEVDLPASPPSQTHDIMLVPRVVAAEPNPWQLERIFQQHVDPFHIQIAELNSQLIDATQQNQHLRQLAAQAFAAQALPPQPAHFQTAAALEGRARHPELQDAPRLQALEGGEGLLRPPPERNILDVLGQNHPDIPIPDSSGDSEAGEAIATQTQADRARLIASKLEEFGFNEEQSIRIIMKGIKERKDDIEEKQSTTSEDVEAFKALKEFEELMKLFIKLSPQRSIQLAAPISKAFEYYLRSESSQPSSSSIQRVALTDLTTGGGGGYPLGPEGTVEPRGRRGRPPLRR